MQGAFLMQLLFSPNEVSEEKFYATLVCLDNSQSFAIRKSLYILPIRLSEVLRYVDLTLDFEKPRGFESISSYDDTSDLSTFTIPEMFYRYLRSYVAFLS